MGGSRAAVEEAGIGSDCGDSSGRGTRPGVARVSIWAGGGWVCGGCWATPVLAPPPPTSSPGITLRSTTGLTRKRDVLKACGRKLPCQAEVPYRPSAAAPRCMLARLVWPPPTTTYTTSTSLRPTPTYSTPLHSTQQPCTQLHLRLRYTILDYKQFF